MDCVSLVRHDEHSERKQISIVQRFYGKYQEPKKREEWLALKKKSTALLSPHLTTIEGAFKTKEEIRNEACQMDCSEIDNCICMRRIEAIIAVYDSYKSGPLWVRCAHVL